MIERLEVTKYRRGPGNYWTDSYDNPLWDLVEAELGYMDRYEKPILELRLHRDRPDAELMMICGGAGVYHVQVVDQQSNWLQACDPNGCDKMIDVWTSDQGFTCEQKYTWSLEDARKIVRHYFETGERRHDYRWS